MSRPPSKIVFICESCQKPAKERHIRKWFGECRRCQGQSWTLCVDYTDTSVDESPVSMLTSMTLGVGWQTTSTSTNQTVIEGVTGEVAFRLTEDRKLVATRVVEYVRLIDQQELRDRGAITCHSCNILYVPNESKPWTRDGYCSKICAVKDGVNASSAYGEAPGKQTGIPKITVVCPNGHEFAVMASFSGCLRPCVDCGEKTPVP